MGNQSSNPEEDNSKNEPKEEDHCKESHEQRREEKEKKHEHKKELQEAKKEHKKEYKDACRHEKEVYKEGKHNLHHPHHNSDASSSSRELERYQREHNFKKDRVSFPEEKCIYERERDASCSSATGKNLSNKRQEQYRQEIEKHKKGYLDPCKYEKEVIFKPPHHASEASTGSREERIRRERHVKKDKINHADERFAHERQSEGSCSSTGKNLGYARQEQKHTEKSKPSTSKNHNAENLPEPRTSECLTEVDREFLKFLTEEEKIKYLHERKKLYEEKEEHIRKIKEEHKQWKVKQQEEHEEFKRRQKEEHKKWKDKQHEEHEEFKRKHKLEHEEAKRKWKEEKRKRKKHKKEDSESSSDSSSSEEEHAHHHLLPRHLPHLRHPHHRENSGLVHNVRHLANHFASHLYRASGARSVWKFAKKKIIRKVIRRTYRKVKRACFSVFNFVFSEDGLPFIVLFISVIFGSYLLWRYALKDDADAE